jgi:hypothetical protein
MARRSLPIPMLCLAAACSLADDAAPAPHAGRPHSLVAAGQRATAALNATWLVGYWDYRRGCGPGDSGTAFWPDGTYTMGDGHGRWSLAGDILTAEIVRPPSRAIFAPRLGDGRIRIVIAGPDEIAARWAGPPDQASPALVSYYRCD